MEGDHEVINPAAHLGLVHSVLSELNARSRAKRSGLEYEDVVQECLLEICKSAAAAPVFECAESTYVHRIVLRTANRILGEEARRAKHEIRMPNGAELEIEDYSDVRRREAIDEIDDRLSRIHGRTLSIVLAFYGIGQEKMTIAAIAARHDLSVVRVKELLAAARREMRRE